jgi:hypothetical protein
MSAESERNNLPFEPNKKRPKSVKATKQQPIVRPDGDKEKKNPYTKEEMAVPKVVSDRMVRRY